MRDTEWFADHGWGVFCHYLGEFWCKGQPRFPDEMVCGYTRHVVSKGGVVTWDVPIQEDGLIPDAFIRQLSAIGTAVENGRKNAQVKPGV